MLKTKKIISLFFVALFMSFYASTTFFSHIHIINGATITHSHLHTGAHHDTKSGGHAECSITLIAQISHFETIEFSCFQLPTPLPFQLNRNTFLETTHWVASIYFQNLTLRAPPII